MGNAGTAATQTGQHRDRNSQYAGDEDSETVRRGTADTCKSLNDAQHLSAKVDALSHSLRNAFPVALVPDDLAEVFRTEANQRLELAQEQGIGLDRVRIGEDCLPTWDTFYWDAEDESLHDTLQQRLLHFQVALDMGKLLQRQIRDKSTQRLRQAQALGINLKDIVIGESMLPEWTTEEDSSGRVDSPLSAVDDTLSGSTRVGNTSESLDTPGDSATGQLGATTCQPLDPEDPALFRGLAPSSTYDSDAESEDIYMNNYVAPHPIYDEQGHSNIVHDVEIVGGDGQVTSVDLEVYMAVDEEDLQDLPGVELAIERKAFEYHFGDQDAVDIHIPDTQIFCFDRIEEYDDDSEKRDEQGTQAGSLVVSSEPTGSMEVDGAEEDAVDLCESNPGTSDSETHSEEE
ncbi:hypothetical protein ED733_008475 [Metarhizium rileyi]|uniref:Uncharacterized protein n=1 Tax=Metarhizium rileyi (strain RCEF 4871) TaxID=1649241 RepID=A0A5C6GLR4_METRR|nr:hypothetical protein ED733_008475 [Metarhizium rileyi]